MDNQEVEDFTGVLVGDVNKCHLILAAEDTQPNRRSLIRAIFAAIEGLTWQLKTNLSQTFRLSLTHHEYAAMQEESYAVSQVGKVETVQRFIPLQTSLRLTIEIIRRLRPTYSVDFGSRGWSNLQSAIKTRNRLVHPKVLEDLEVSNSDLEKAMSAFYWMLARNIEVLRESVASLKDRADKVKRVTALIEPKDRKAWLKMVNQVDAKKTKIVTKPKKSSKIPK